MKTLENKVAIVTGGGAGIGKSICHLFAAEGAKVVLSDIVEQSGNETVEEIKSKGGDAIFVRSDSSKPEDCKALVDKAMSAYGGLHIAVNNAGIGGPLVPTAEYPIDQWNTIISVNLSGVFYGMRYQIPAMIASGGGSIINMSSILGHAGRVNACAYVSAKHGLEGLTKTAALEYATQKVRVNSICPGYILTPLLVKYLDEAARKETAALHAMNRLGTTEEVAELTVFLASDKSSFITGSSYSVDGGYLAH